MKAVTYFRDEIAKQVARTQPYPGGRFAGAGVVICAGGRTYYTCAWVLVKLLRRLGCRLPIEVWYRGRPEMSPRMRDLLESVPAVRCVDASAGQHSPRLNGWEIKPYAIINSRFEELLFIDCDNVPTRDPSFLLSSEPYKRFGAVFWPDRWMSKRDKDKFRTIAPEAWEACGMAPRDEPEFESGQMVINKRRCWGALQLTMFLNKHSDHFYEWLLGDKDTFHLSWRRIGQDYAMPMFRPAQDWYDGPVIYQHGFDGQRLFQHRNQDKWSYDGHNMTIPGFRHEETCLGFRDELRERWDGVVRRYPTDYTEVEQRAYDAITTTRLFRYGPSTADARLVELRPDFTVGLGRGKWETAWEIEEAAPGQVVLALQNKLRKMCILRPSGDTRWSGHRLHFEREQVAVEPISCLPSPQRQAAEEVNALLRRLPSDGGAVGQELKNARSFIYRRVGYDSRPMNFESGHNIGRGSAACERWWFVDPSLGSPALLIYGDRGATCALTRSPDGTWEGQWQRFERMPVELIPGAAAANGPSPSYYGRESRSYY